MASCGVKQKVSSSEFNDLSTLCRWGRRCSLCGPGVHSIKTSPNKTTLTLTICIRCPLLFLSKTISVCDVPRYIFEGIFVKFDIYFDHFECFLQPFVCEIPYCMIITYIVSCVYKSYALNYFVLGKQQYAFAKYTISSTWEDIYRYLSKFIFKLRKHSVRRIQLNRSVYNARNSR